MINELDTMYDGRERSRTVVGRLAIFVMVSACVATSVVAASGREMLRIYPSDVTVTAGRRVRFTAVTRVGDRDAYTASTLQWSATGGRIDDEGVYVAGNEAGDHLVEVAHAGRRATAVVRVMVDRDEPETGFDLPPSAYLMVRHWRHGRADGRYASVHVVARSFGTSLAEVRLVAVGVDGRQEVVARQSSSDRSRSVLRGTYDPEWARWLELRLVNDQGQIVDRKRRLV